MATARTISSLLQLRALIVLSGISLASPRLYAAPSPTPGEESPAVVQAEEPAEGLPAAPEGTRAAPAPAPAVRARPRAIAPSPAPPAEAALPGCDTEGLSAEQRGALVTLMREGPCLCAPDRSLLACIQAESCPAATKLGQFGARAFKAGLSASQVREEVIRRFIILAQPPATFELEGVPHKGPAGAPIVLVEFADFQCPHCAMVRAEIARVQAAFPEQVVVYFKQFPLSSHGHSETAARAALAAHQQGAFWPMHELIFSNQSSLNEGSFLQFARMLGLDLVRFTQALESEEIQRLVRRDQDEGVRAQLTGTPTLFINGRMYPDAMTFDVLRAHIQGLLAQSP